MNILELAFIHDMKLLQLISMITMLSILEMEKSELQTFKNIYGVN